MNTDNNKIVYSALSRMTDDREVVKQAFTNWHSAFAGAKLDIFAFVDHIEAYLGITTAEKKVLMMSMHAASSKGSDGLSDVPAYILDGQATPNNASGAAVTETSQVAVKPPAVALSQVYFNRMLGGLKSKDKAEVVEILADEGLPDASDALNRALKRLDSTDVDLPKDMSEDECKSLCHETYMLICDIVGPTSADDLSYKAVNSMLESSEADRYDPKNLI